MCHRCAKPDRRALLGGLVVLPLISCSENVHTGRSQLAFVPDAQLVQLADQAWAELVSTTPASTDPAIHERLARVAGPISRAAGRDDLQWQFVVFESPDLNAFVLPNGKVAVFRGMMDFVGDDHELGAVVAHEVAHIVARHSAERVSQTLATQVGVSIAQLVLGGENGENADLVAGIFGLGATYGILLPYSRRHELEADRVGVTLMEKVGLEPTAAVRFWERMMARQGRTGAPIESLSTHPADDRRLAELKAAIGARGW
jgi:predicted Zn-dependent protease